MCTRAQLTRRGVVKKEAACRVTCVSLSSFCMLLSHGRRIRLVAHTGTSPSDAIRLVKEEIGIKHDCSPRRDKALRLTSPSLVMMARGASVAKTIRPFLMVQLLHEEFIARRRWSLHKALSLFSILFSTPSSHPEASRSPCQATSANFSLWGKCSANPMLYIAFPIQLADPWLATRDGLASKVGGCSNPYDRTFDKSSKRCYMRALYMSVLLHAVNKLQLFPCTYLI